MTRLGLAFALLLGGCVHKDASRFDEGDRGQLDPGEWNVKITRKGVYADV